ncbi:MFS transporter [Saccharothrix sp. ALI-22-I]|uniref:MFS transporter n=1 Tax=Saccharothrix sp. ALI-22-I TaxID=1933778 RepID=UPI003FD6B94E
MTVDNVPPKAGRREWLGLAVLVLPTILTMIDVNVLFLALPHLSADLGTSATQQLWITDSYGFAIAGFLVTMGTLGDRIGYRKLLMIGGAAFGLASVLAAWSSSPGLLIAARLLLGVAGATIMPSTLALIRTMFTDPKQMGTAISVWASAIIAGVALGPVIGGVMLEYFWWGSVFLIGVPVMVLLVVAGPVLLPEHRDPDAGRLDLVSVFLSLGTVLSAVYGLKELARDGWGLLPVAFVVVGVAFGAVFVIRQGRLASPLLDLRLLRIRVLASALLAGLFVGAIQSGSGLMVTQHLQLVEGLEPLQAGLWLLPPTVVLVIGIYLSPPLARRIRPGYVLVGGALIAAAGQLVITQVSATSGLALLLIGFGVVYLGVSPMGVLVAQIAMESCPPEKAGSAASLSSTGSELGVALGIATLGTVGTLVYRGEVNVPAEVPPAAADAANESMAGAAAAAPNLPPQVATDLLDSARESFTSGLHVVAGVAAVLFVGLAVLIAVTFRHVPPSGADPADHAEEIGPDGPEKENHPAV